MPAPLTKTRTPGVYKRGDRYCFVFRDANGRQRQESARTYEDARTLKCHREADVSRGEHHAASRTRLDDYAREWVERVPGLRPDTREAYRLLLNVYALRYFGSKRLGQITPRDVAGFVAWLAQQRTKGRKAKPGTAPKPGTPLSDATIRKAVSPLRSCLASAVREGELRHNPARDVKLPHRESVEDDDDVQVLTRDQLATVLRVVDPRYKLLCRLIASTGLRISEAIGLQWRHVELNGDEGRALVRQRIVNGKVGLPKSKKSRRDVPLPPDLVRDLRRARMGAKRSDEDSLVFETRDGKPVDVRNVRRRHLQPAMKAAGAPWAGWHTLRHTYASMMFERGLNAVQVAKLLGHADAAFTLRTYVHVLSDDLGAPLDLASELRPADTSADTRAV